MPTSGRKIDDPRPTDDPATWAAELDELERQFESLQERELRARATGTWIDDWQSAERSMTVAMRRLGFADGHSTPAGSDVGIDIEATGAVAQVKMFTDKRVGRPMVQQLLGAARGRSPIFFAFGVEPFTPQATAWAEENQIALFSFDHCGDVHPRTSLATTLFTNWDAADLGPDSGPTIVPTTSRHAVYCARPAYWKVVRRVLEDLPRAFPVGWLDIRPLPIDARLHRLADQPKSGMEGARRLERWSGHRRAIGPADGSSLSAAFQVTWKQLWENRLVRKAGLALRLRTPFDIGAARAAIALDRPIGCAPNLGDVSVDRLLERSRVHAAGEVEALVRLVPREVWDGLPIAAEVARKVNGGRQYPLIPAKDRWQLVALLYGCEIMGASLFIAAVVDAG